MDQIHAATPVEKTDVQTPRPWGLAVLSGAIFGGLAAAATNWLGLHSQPFINRGKVNFARNWATGIAGVSAGAVAVYGTLRSAEEPPHGVHNEAPDAKIDASEVEHHGNARILSPGERSL